MVTSILHEGTTYTVVKPDVGSTCTQSRYHTPTHILLATWWQWIGHEMWGSPYVRKRGARGKECLTRGCDIPLAVVAWKSYRQRIIHGMWHFPWRLCLKTNRQRIIHGMWHSPWRLCLKTNRWRTIQGCDIPLAVGVISYWSETWEKTPTDELYLRTWDEWNWLNDEQVIHFKPTITQVLLWYARSLILITPNLMSAALVIFCGRDHISVYSTSTWHLRGQNNQCCSSIITDQYQPSEGVS